MSNLIEVTDATKIKPVNPALCKVRRCTPSATVTAGYPVYRYSDGTIRIASGSTAAANRVLGVAMQTSSSEPVDVVTFGPVYCLTGATPGGLLKTLDSAGGMDHTGGTKKTVVGVAETAEILFVRPRMGNLT